MSTPVCSNCGSHQIEYFDGTTGEFVPGWLVDAQGIMNWDTGSDSSLCKWQDYHGYSDDEMQDSVDGLINSERLAGPRPKGYASPAKALQRRVRMGYDKPKMQNANGRAPTHKGKYY